MAPVPSAPGKQISAVTLNPLILSYLGIWGDGTLSCNLSSLIIIIKKLLAFSLSFGHYKYGGNDS